MMQLLMQSKRAAREGRPFPSSCATKPDAAAAACSPERLRSLRGFEEEVRWRDRAVGQLRLASLRRTWRLLRADATQSRVSVLRIDSSTESTS